MKPKTNQTVKNQQKKPIKANNHEKEKKTTTIIWVNIYVKEMDIKKNIYA